MKALWPSTLLAIATSSPLVQAQDRAPAAPPAPTAAPAPPAGSAAPSTAAPAAPAPVEGAGSTPAAKPAGADGAASADGATGAEGAAGPGSAAEAAPPAEASPAPAPQPGHALFATTAAEEAPPAQPAKGKDTPAEAAPAPPARPASSNRGHFRLGARAGLVAPFGMVAEDTPLLDVAGMGAGYGLDLSFGVAEDVTIGAYGDLLILDRTQGCAECAPLSYGAGLMVRYHLVQGLRFDPWAAYGLGVIGMAGTPPNGEGAYQGLEWMRLTFGGDWYALPNLGLGPYVELGAGSFWSVPDGETTAGVHFRFQVGMRLVLDLPGRRD